MENQLIYLEGNTIKVRRLSVEVFFPFISWKIAEPTALGSKVFLFICRKFQPEQWKHTLLY